MRRLPGWGPCTRQIRSCTDGKSFALLQFPMQPFLRQQLAWAPCNNTNDVAPCSLPYAETAQQGRPHLCIRPGAAIALLRPLHLESSLDRHADTLLQ